MHRVVPLVPCLLVALASLAHPQDDPLRIRVRADQVLGPVSPLLTGACIEDVNHEIYGGLYSQMVFGESFQEPPPAPAIKDFTSLGGHWLARDGVVSIDAADGPKLLSRREPFKDGSVGVELRFADRKGDNAGLILRVSKPGIGADTFNGYEVSLDAARQVLRLARHRHNYELIRDVPCKVPLRQWITLEARLAGPSIEILVDGQSLLRHDDVERALPAGTVGLRAWHRQADYRALWVRTADKLEPLPFLQMDPEPQISGMWRAVRRGSAAGQFAVTSQKPFVGTQAQHIAFDSGQGEWGIENQGLNRWGMNFEPGKPYEGCAWVRADKPLDLSFALQSRDGSRTYAESTLAVAAGDWQRLDFTLTPDAADKVGRLALVLKKPGSLSIGYVFLQPGPWGRFKQLPVRRDVAEALIDQGITVLRYGGSMVNHPEYRWKNMIGPRDRRPPYRGHWYAHSTNGWGIVDFMNFCEAAGFEYIPDFHMGESPQDMADFIQYAKGAPDTDWGRRRAADGHPQPYRLRYLQLGNEERVDERYAQRFEALAQAIWAADPEIILVVGDFAYHQRIVDPMNFRGADSGITSLAGQRRILQFAKQHQREVWFDLHVWTDGPRPDSSFDAMLSFVTAMEKLADGAKHKVVVFEFNAGNHSQRRALGNALAIQTIERDGRIPIALSANCLQPDGQNDNGWDQGLLFLNPSQVWLQPPGYVTQMYARHYEPRLVKCAVSAAEKLDATAKVSEDGKTLVVTVVNPTAAEQAAQLQLEGFVPGQGEALVVELAGLPTGVNTAAAPRSIVPKERQWRHGMKQGSAPYTFPAHSVTVIRFGAP